MSVVTVPTVGKYGVAADAIPQELPLGAWTAVRNVRFANGEAVKHSPSFPIFTATTAQPYFLLPYMTGSARHWIQACLAKIFTDDGSTRTDLTPTAAPTGTADSRWTGGVLGGVPVLNNQTDAPWYWDGDVAHDFTLLTGKGWDATWRCKSLRPYKQFLVALNVTKGSTVYRHMVKWSASAAAGAIPTSWNEADATKDAGEVDLAETTDPLVDQLTLGDQNIIYGERSMYAMQYIGAPYIFRFTRIPGDIGAIAQNCIANTPLGHVVFGPGDVFLHSGQGPRSILTGRMRSWLFNRLSNLNFGRSFVVANPRTEDVWICFPSGASEACDLALTWNWSSDTLGIRDLTQATHGAAGQITASAITNWKDDSQAWKDDATTWNGSDYLAGEGRMVFADSSANLRLADSGTYIDNDSVTCQLERIGMAFDAPDVVKTVRSVTPRVSGSAGMQLQIQVGASMDAEAAPNWSPAVAYTVGTSRKADTFATGRFLSLRISTTASNAWRIKSVDLDIAMRGTA